MTFLPLVEELSVLEQRLLELTCDPKIIGQYALGKVELMNLYGGCGGSLFRAYTELVSYCKSYVSCFEDLEANEE